MAKKYYAVQKGRAPGIYVSWSDCERQIKGFSGAVYKSFSTMAEAEAFIKNGSVSMTLAEYFGDAENGSPEPTQKGATAILIAYIDGSFDKKAGAVGAGGIIFQSADCSDGEEFSFGTRDSLYTAYWNVAGELLAATYVIEQALARECTECHLYYDYQGIEMWATGRWKTNNPLTRSYANFCKEACRKVRLYFHKVAAHTGVLWNERADSLAKAGIHNI